MKTDEIKFVKNLSDCDAMEKATVRTRQMSTIFKKDIS